MQQSVQQHIARTPHVKSARSLPIDSLLSVADLSSVQRDRIKMLLSLPKQVDSLSQIESRLDQFDRNTVQNLEEGEQEVVLQMSALLRAQVDVIERLLASEVAELFERSGSTDAVFLKDDGDDDDDRPEWNEFYSEEDIIQAGTSMGITVGGTAATSCTAVAVLCGVSFGAGGAFAGAAWEYSSQYDEYQTQLADWCQESGNSHSSCQEDLP